MHYLKGLIKNNLVSAVLFSAVISNVAIADKAPDFSLQGDETIIKLSSFKGKVIYLDFWASWCVPCRQSFPFMNDMHKKYSADGLKVIAINLDTERDKAARFLKKVPAVFTIAYDPEGKVPELYKLSAVPSFYLINRDGEIVFKHSGFRHSQNEKLESKIRQVLSEDNNSKLSPAEPIHL